MRKFIAALLMIGVSCAIAQDRPTAKMAKSSSISTCGKEFRAALIGSIHATGEMAVSAPELAWQLDRVEAQRSASRTVQLADNDKELKAAAYAREALDSEEGCRALHQAGATHERMEASGCWTKAGELEQKAMDVCSLSFKQVHPRISDFE
jgi:hypothetical protein